MKPIILVGATEAFARRFHSALPADRREQVRMWPSQVAEPGGLQAIFDADPLVLVFGPGLVDEVSFSLATRVDAEKSEVGVIVVQNADVRSIDDALAAGVRAVLSKSSSDEAIRTAVDRAVLAAERHAGGSTPAPTAVSDQKAARARVTTVLSPKGGAGKTVLSTNLAVGLASRSPRGVVIVDLDLQFGDVAYALGLRPRHTMFDAVGGPLDITTLKVYLTHHNSDLYVLCAPDEPDRGELIPVEMVQEVISLLASDFDHVVLDTGAGLDEHALAALDLSTDVVFLADMDVPSVRHLTKVVAAFDRLGMRGAERHFVLNRADARVGMSMAQVATQAGLAVDLKVPHSKQVPVALNEGVPILLSNPKSPVTRKVWDLVDRIAGSGAQDTRSPLRWSA